MGWEEVVARKPFRSPNDWSPLSGGAKPSKTRQPEALGSENRVEPSILRLPAIREKAAKWPHAKVAHGALSMADFPLVLRNDQ
jgi:hypothetical protein